MKSSIRPILGLVVTSLVVSCVHAQDFYWNVASAQSMSLGGVYVPSSAGALDALAANPAGLTALTGRTVDLSLTGIFARGSFSNSVNHDAPLNTSPGVLPTGAFGAPIGHSRFSFGIGVVPELMSVADWRYRDAPGVGGASYGLVQQKSAILAARTAAGLGFSVSPALAIGVTAGLVYNSNTLEAPYIFQSNPALAGLKTLLDLHTSGLGWNTSVGALARPTRKLRLGVAWKSRTVIECTGKATGTLDQQFAVLGIPFQPDYSYSARVKNVLPQSIVASVMWQVDPRWLLAFQTNWVNWKDAFVNLPVTLTNGTNTDINSFLHSNSISDGVPLNWKDQYSFHGGFQRLLSESVLVRGGYSHANNPVPGSTLTPLTAAIMSNQLTAGIGYRYQRWIFDLGYAFELTGHSSVGQSALLNGEYDNSQVRVGTQSLILNTSFHF
jgi:long-chain fatty acid transport protein